MGGRGVFYDEEFIYSVIVFEEYFNMFKIVIEVYCVIFEGLLEGFCLLGFEVYFVIFCLEEEKNSLKNFCLFVCFDVFFWYELVVEGCKIVGSV